MGTGMLTCWEGKTDLCRRSSIPPQQKNYIEESGLNAKEIEMGTTAQSLELWFQLYLLLCSNLVERPTTVYIFVLFLMSLFYYHVVWISPT